MRKYVMGVLAGSGLAFGMVSNTSGAIVLNGGFELGTGSTPTSWSINPDPNATAAGAYNGRVTNGANPPPTGPVNSGTYAEEISAINSPTNPAPPGEDSNIFELTPAAGGDPISTAGGPYTLTYSIRGTLGVSGVVFVQAQYASAAGPIGGGGQFTFSNPGTFPSVYTVETLNLGTPPANATGVDVAFSAETGAVTGGSSIAFVDDVSVTGAAVPEPASLSVLCVCGLGVLRRRRA